MGSREYGFYNIILGHIIKYTLFYRYNNNLNCIGMINIKISILINSLNYFHCPPNNI